MCDLGDLKHQKWLKGGPAESTGRSRDEGVHKPPYCIECSCQILVRRTEFFHIFLLQIFVHSFVWDVACHCEGMDVTWLASLCLLLYR